MKDIPETFYIFCNTLNLVTYHNLKYGKSFSSAGFVEAHLNEESKKRYLDGTATYLPYERTQPSVNTVSPFMLTAMNEYRIEHDAEHVRIKYFPKLPSRMSAVYAFGDMETCREVSNKWGWSLESVKEFKLVPNELNRVIKVNMEVVSLARGVYKGASWSLEDIENIWKHYWSGNGNLSLDIPEKEFRKVVSSGITWEYLIEGHLKLL